MDGFQWMQLLIHALTLKAIYLKRRVSEKGVNNHIPKKGMCVIS